MPVIPLPRILHPHSNVCLLLFPTPSIPPARLFSLTHSPSSTFSSAFTKLNPRGPPSSAEGAPHVPGTHLDSAGYVPRREPLPPALPISPPLALFPLPLSSHDKATGSTPTAPLPCQLGGRGALPSPPPTPPDRRFPSPFLPSAVTGESLRPASTQAKRRGLLFAFGLSAADLCSTDRPVHLRAGGTSVFRGRKGLAGGTARPPAQTKPAPATTWPRGPHEGLLRGLSCRDGAGGPQVPGSAPSRSPRAHRLKCSMIFSSRTFSGKLPTQRCLVSRTMLRGRGRGGSLRSAQRRAAAAAGSWPPPPPLRSAASLRGAGAGGGHHPTAASPLRRLLALLPLLPPPPAPISSTRSPARSPLSSSSSDGGTRSGEERARAY